ncbi:hypothetical protein LTR78_010954 [Recurvomyces mirabilis]|uniref:Transcription factor domain-containing protein n=1 Tax=Recurvomyces mirabilis TaxID=574656 RepID=A0AAE0TPI3_9PEZI|nr:hypothetical protein LTR78_010954 [Recurvomyces mirabilis]KAK5149471.1 hypothetical protein LTS14_010912 [Recurvomyces mirabilis]
MAMQFIGSLSDAPGSSALLKARAIGELATADPSNLEIIQACLLLAIAFHGQNELQESAQYLKKAIDGALGGALYMTDSDDLKPADAIIAESARRTWWELWVIEAFMIMLHHSSMFRCGNIVSTPCLPCEDSLYSKGVTLHNNPLPAQYSARVFFEPEPDFSSYAHRIEAVRAISRSFNTKADDVVSPSSMKAMDNAISSWLHHLPQEKSSAVRQDGHVDELMLQAQLFVHLAAILTHLPRSGLPLTIQASCVSNMTSISPASQQSALKAQASANEIISLAALPTNTHSPLTVCCLVFACAAQLSAAAAAPQGSLIEYQDSVTMAMGVIKSIGRTWELGLCALRRLRPVAAQVFHVTETAAIGDQNTITTGDTPQQYSGTDPAIPIDLSDFDWSKFLEDLQDQFLDTISG